MRIAIFPGSFDPITNGHLDIIHRAAALYDALVVAISVNPNKGGGSPMERRTDMVRQVVGGLDNVQVEHFSGLLVAYAAKRGAQVIVRGLRAANDFEYEFQMAQLNRGLESTVETLFMMTSPQYAYISSSSVREIAALGGDIGPLVPPVLRTQIERAYGPCRKA